MNFYYRVIFASLLMGVLSFFIWSNNQNQVIMYEYETKELSTVDFKGIKIQLLDVSENNSSPEYLNYILINQNEILKQS